MYPYIHIVLPSYGVLAGIGGFLTLIFLYFRLEKYQIDFIKFIKCFVVAVCGGFVGSKLLYIITYLPWLIKKFSLQNLIDLIGQSGFVYYGGLFGVLIGVWFYLRKDSDNKKKVFKMIVPAIPLFHGFGRIGCMLSGCCYGKELENILNIWGLEFDKVPVQLIEAGFEFLLFFIFVLLEKMGSRLYSVNVYLFIYAIFRFVIEFFRGDKLRGIWFGGLSTAQYISLAILFYMFMKILTKNKECKGKN